MEKPFSTHLILPVRKSFSSFRPITLNGIGQKDGPFDKSFFSASDKSYSTLFNGSKSFSGIVNFGFSLKTLSLTFSGTFSSLFSSCSSVNAFSVFPCLLFRFRFLFLLLCLSKSPSILFLSILKSSSSISKSPS